MPSMMKAPHSKGANCPMCDGGACKMAEGGEVNTSKGGSSTQDVSSNRRHQKGVHESMTRGDAGTSTAGGYIPGHGYGSNPEGAKPIHRRVLGEMRAMKGKDRTNLAEGGDVEKDDGDEELSHGLGKELMGAFESKDHKKLMSSLEACVLHCISKNGDEDV